MLKFISAFRDSEIWRGINDILAIQALIGLAVGTVSGIAAWVHGQPLYAIIFWFFASATVALGTIHIGWNLWSKRKDGRKEPEPVLVKEPEPNLVFKTPAITGGIIRERSTWMRGYSNTLRYEVWLVPIKNEPIPNKEVVKAERITAEIVLSSGGTTLLEVSPAFWLGQPSTKIDIECPGTRELIVAFRESVSGCGYWEMGNSHGIPFGAWSGELKIRILRERDSKTSFLVTKFYTWRRAPELGDFEIKER